MLMLTVIITSCNGNKYRNIKLQSWEKTALTNAVYKLAGTDIYTDSQRERIAKYVLDLRGSKKEQWNVVDVLEMHPELFGYFGEDDVSSPNIQDGNYKRAEKIVNRIVS